MLGSLTKIMLAAALAAAALSPAVAAKRHVRAHAPKMSGACAQAGGRCISNCDQLNWCQMNTCVSGQSTPVPFWRCFEPSGLCLAPHC